MKFLSFVTIGFLVTLTTLSGCKKEGPAGPAGKDGVNGIDGNANVNAYTVTVASGNWILSGNTYYVDVSVAGITPDILNSGSVQIFMESTTSTGVWLNMPWIEYVSSSIFSTYNFNYSTGSARIFKTDSDLTAPGNPGVRNFKIVVIASSAMIANPDINWKNYKKIEERFSLTK